MNVEENVKVTLRKECEYNVRSVTVDDMQHVCLM